MNGDDYAGQKGTGTDAREAEAEATPRSPLSAIYPGEPVTVAGRQVWVRPWGVKAMMTQVPGLVGSLMGRLTPVYEAFRNKETMGNEAILSALMQNAGSEIVAFASKTVGLTPEEEDVMTAEEFTALLLAIVRQNRGFFDQLGNLYRELGRPLASVVAGTGSP